MRSFFYKEVIPANVEKRNYILRKLHFLKNVSNSKEIVAKLRAALKTTDEQVKYYRSHRGLKIYLGDGNISKKQFLLSKDSRYLQPVISKLRSEQKKDITSTPKIYYLPYGHLKFFKTGGVLTAPGVFLGEVKKLKRYRGTTAKYPKREDTTPYIGIELEYASKLSIDAILDLLAEHNLQNCVRVMRDGSIHVGANHPYQVEFCILAKQDELDTILDRLKPIIFDKPELFQANSSCGMHVHLDVRHDNPKRVFKNLVSMQTVLFRMAADSRTENQYCQPVDTTDFDLVDEHSDRAHYDAISKFSYFKHKTIEVRIHESTLNLQVIKKWVTLLKRIADYKGTNLGYLGTFDSEFKLLKEEVKIEPELIEYIESAVV